MQNPTRRQHLKRLVALGDAAGVEVRFFTRLIDVDADHNGKNVYGAILQNIEGYRYVAADKFVDATGDAVPG